MLFSLLLFDFFVKIPLALEHPVYNLLGPSVCLLVMLQNILIYQYVIFSVLESQGYVRTLNSNEADAWLLVTCSIRENAEDKIWKKLNYIKALKSHGKVSFY